MRTGECLIANNQAYGYDTAPSSRNCWIRDGDHYSCYDYNAKGNCDIWPGANGTVTDCKFGKQPAARKLEVQLQPICTGQCMIANNPRYGNDTAPTTRNCWILDEDHYSCYDYNAQGNCDIWPGAIGTVTDCHFQK